jgi:hypothetical protein
MIDEKYRPFVWLAGFIVGRNWFKKYSLQKLYLNLKEPL